MEKILVVYWSGTGNTEIMAQKIAEGVKAAGAEADLREVSSVAADEVKGFNKIAFGCPSMGEEVLEEEAFEPFFQSVEGDLSGKKVALFGSYGWGDGAWMRDWVQRATDDGANVLNGEGLILNQTPDEAGEEQCVELGKKLVSF